jgi:plastocyanin
MRTRLPILLAIALIALFAGCGDDESAPNEPASSGGDRVDEIVHVRMKDILFEPEHVTVKIGQTVRWTNGDAVAHNVTAKKGADFASDSLSRGETFDAKLDKAGTIAYVCTLHSGQKGSITVEG